MLYVRPKPGGFEVIKAMMHGVTDERLASHHDADGTTGVMATWLGDTPYCGQSHSGHGGICVGPLCAGGWRWLSCRSLGRMLRVATPNHRGSALTRMRARPTWSPRPGWPFWPKPRPDGRRPGRPMCRSRSRSRR
jgi:hypothetical protein